MECSSVNFSPDTESHGPEHQLAEPTRPEGGGTLFIESKTLLASEIVVDTDLTEI